MPKILNPEETRIRTVYEPPLQPVPLPENASITYRPAYRDARQIIATIFAACLEHDLMARGYEEMRPDLLSWSETTISAQAEALPTE